MTKRTPSIAKLKRSAWQQDRAGTSLWRDSYRRFRRHKLGMFGAAIVFLLLAVAIFAPLVLRADPNAMDFQARFLGPTTAHPLGTDNFGRDTLLRIAHGARLSLQVSLIAVSIGATLGTSLGMVAGYTHKRLLDEAIMRSMDVLFAFPAMLLAIAILAILGRGVANAMIALGIVYIPIFARIARGAVLSVREEEFIGAARLLGASDAYILAHHILPNILAPLIVETTLGLSFAILAEAALSFFGLSTQPPDPSWGRMLSEARGFYRQSVWMNIFPGLAIMLTVMGFNFLGDGLRDALDPRLKNAASRHPLRTPDA
ncbi:MAG: ABC transporter permease [Chloroflexi bacterium]|nr:MAG: ABC transporter permease [Chloroflexota bacterium]